MIVIVIVIEKEVEYDKFTNLFSVEMEKNGYAAHWAPKSRFHYLEPSAQQEVDGCAIFVRRSKSVLSVFSLFSSITLS